MNSYCNTLFVILRPPLKVITKIHLVCLTKKNDVCYRILLYIICSSPNKNLVHMYAKQKGHAKRDNNNNAIKHTKKILFRVMPTVKFFLALF